MSLFKVKYGELSRTSVHSDNLFWQLSQQPHRSTTPNGASDQSLTAMDRFTEAMSGFASDGNEAREIVASETYDAAKLAEKNPTLTDDVKRVAQRMTGMGKWIPASQTHSDHTSDSTPLLDKSQSNSMSDSFDLSRSLPSQQYYKELTTWAERFSDVFSLGSVLELGKVKGSAAAALRQMERFLADWHAFCWQSRQNKYKGKAMQQVVANFAGLYRDLEAAFEAVTDDPRNVGVAIAGVIKAFGEISEPSDDLLERYFRLYSDMGAKFEDPTGRASAIEGLMDAGTYKPQQRVRYPHYRQYK